MRFRKKAGTGLHKFKLNGKTITARSGSIVDCEPENLGSSIDQYEILSGKKENSASLLEKEVMRQEYLIKAKSQWLNDAIEDKNNPNPIPTTLDGLKLSLVAKESELGFIKDVLDKAWEEWEIECEKDPLSKLDPKQPQDSHLEKIARLKALVTVTSAEVNEIKNRIKTAVIPVEKHHEEDIRRKRWRGVYKCNEDREIIICDGREVILNDKNQPVFKDTGESVKDYLEECKKRKRDRRKTAPKRTRVPAT